MQITPRLSVDGPDRDEEYAVVFTDSGCDTAEHRLPHPRRGRCADRGAAADRDGANVGRKAGTMTVEQMTTELLSRGWERHTDEGWLAPSGIVYLVSTEFTYQMMLIAQHSASSKQIVSVTCPVEPDVDRMVSELWSAGWVPHGDAGRRWMAPDGAIFMGPAGAWRYMKFSTPMSELIAARGEPGYEECLKYILGIKAILDSSNAKLRSDCREAIRRLLAEVDKAR